MVQVDSANKHGILLEVVQVLTDLNLIITKAYIYSDGGWFMDGVFRYYLVYCLHCQMSTKFLIILVFFSVFHVTDKDGNKLRDEEILDYIRKVLSDDLYLFGLSYYRG